MLDFFLDHKGQPDEVAERVARGPIEEVRVLAIGGIDLEPFHSLDHVWTALRMQGIDVNYFSDFAWTAAQVEAVGEVLQRHASKLTDPRSHVGFQTMYRIVESARSMRAGLVAVCD